MTSSLSPVQGDSLEECAFSHCEMQRDYEAGAAGAGILFALATLAIILVIGLKTVL